MKKYLILLLALCCTNIAFAASKTKSPAGYKIDVDAPQLKNEMVYLGMYFYGKLYSKDTVQLNDKGQGSFIKDKPLHEGMYTIYFMNSKVVDMLVSDEQDFKVKIDTTDLVNKVFVTGSEQSEGFQNYVKFISSKRTEVEKISKQYESALKGKDSIQAQKERQEKIDAIDKEVETYQANVIQTYGDKALGVVLKALTQIKTPEITAENDSIRQREEYYYNRQHFFDNINLSDPRLLYTVFLPQKIDFYIQRMLPQIPDTLTTEVVKLIEMSKGDTLTYKNMLTNMLNYAVKSNLMGMDGLTLRLAEDYYLAGKAPWADSTLLANLEKEVKKTKYNQIGTVAPNLFVETFDGKKINLLDMPQEYVLLYFFEPSCGHCRKETPVIHDVVYQKYKKDNFFEVFAFYTHTDKEEWKKFIDEHGLHDWTNVWDPQRTSYFWHYYDTTTTPGLYLLNKERKIIAKKIDKDTLDMILENEKKRQTP